MAAPAGGRQAARRGGAAAAGAAGACRGRVTAAAEGGGTAAGAPPSSSSSSSLSLSLVSPSPLAPMPPLLLPRSQNDIATTAEGAREEEKSRERKGARARDRDAGAHERARCTEATRFRGGDRTTTIEIAQHQNNKTLCSATQRKTVTPRAAARKGEKRARSGRRRKKKTEHFSPHPCTRDDFFYASR